MIKAIKLLLLILILYVLIHIMSFYNTDITIEIYQYKITTTIFFTLLVLSILMITTLVIIKLITYIINIPLHITNYHKERKTNDNINNILASYRSYIINQNIEDDNVAILKQYKDYYNDRHLLIYLAKDNLEQQIIELQKLTKTQELKFYAHKKLVSILIKLKQFNDALSHLNTAISIEKYDQDLNYLGLEIFVKLSMWDNFVNHINCIEEEEFELDKNKKERISNHFIDLYNYYLTNNIEEKIMYAIEQSLKYNQDNVIAIEILCKYYLQHKEEDKIISTLDAALTRKASIEIYDLYKQFSNMNPIELKEHILSIIDTTKNPTLHKMILKTI